jgi:hypothetical protein
MKQRRPPGESMTLGNMRDQMLNLRGVRNEGLSTL